jgi:hypothetical protein
MVNGTGEELATTHNSTFEFFEKGVGEGFLIVGKYYFGIMFQFDYCGKRSYS